MGRDTSGMICCAREHTHTSANALEGAMPDFRRMEAKAWQREKGAEAAWGGAEAAAAEDAAAARAGGLKSDCECMAMPILRKDPMEMCFFM